MVKRVKRLNRYENTQQIKDNNTQNQSQYYSFKSGYIFGPGSELTISKVLKKLRSVFIHEQVTVNQEQNYFFFNVFLMFGNMFRPCARMIIYFFETYLIELGEPYVYDDDYLEYNADFNFFLLVLANTLCSVRNILNKAVDYLLYLRVFLRGRFFYKLLKKKKRIFTNVIEKIRFFFDRDTQNRKYLVKNDVQHTYATQKKRFFVRKKKYLKICIHRFLKFQLNFVIWYNYMYTTYPKIYDEGIESLQYLMDSKSRNRHIALLIKKCKNCLIYKSAPSESSIHLLKKKKALSIHMFWHYIYKSLFLQRFITIFMRFGKKERMETILFDLLSLIKKSTRKQPIFLFNSVVRALQPLMRQRIITRAGKPYHIPFSIGFKRRLFSFFKTLRETTREFKKINRFKETVAEELASAILHTGKLYLKIHDMHCNAFDNRINLRFTHKYFRLRNVFI